MDARYFLTKNWVWLLLICFALLSIYLPGFGNELIFDDQRLKDGTIFAAYGSLLELKQRLLSYGSLVWVNQVFGPDWVWQRAVNLLLHCGVTLALFALVRGLIAQVQWTKVEPNGLPASRSIEPGQNAAALVSVAFFAFNPVAVYAVAYLVQRSILMATLFSVLSIYFAVLAATRNRLFLFGAVACYVLALLSKEHAVALPLVALAAFLIAARPSRKTVAWTVVAASLLCVAGAGFLWWRYSEIFGTAFDANSQAYLAQLEDMAPGIGSQVYWLSIINQAWLFLKYGLMWVIPNIGWMALDLRPEFPLTLTAFPQVLGPVLYLGILVEAMVLMVRYRDWRRYVGFGLFAPSILFMTEFATVWIQDPFVLYRSYLWAIGLPFLVAAAFAGIQPRKTMYAGIVMSLVFIPLAAERVFSMRNEYVAWLDTVARVDLNAPRNAIGRWRPIMNRGNQFAIRGMLEEALSDYALASRVGDPTGISDYHKGVMLKRLGKPEEALIALASATHGRAVPPELIGLPALELGELLFGMGRHSDAIAALDEALAKLPDEDSKIRALKLRAQSSIRLGLTDDAVSDYRKVLELRSGDRASRVGYALALNANGQREEALALLASMAAERDDWDVKFARAMILDSAGRGVEAYQEAVAAQRLNPGDVRIVQLVKRLEP